MKVYQILLFAAVIMATASCKPKPGADEDKKFPEDALYKITPFEHQPFLGETYINDYDYEAGNKFLVDAYCNKPSGACSSYRVANYAARNLDWFIRDYALLVIHTASCKAKNRYASVAILSSNSIITRDFIQGGIVKDEVQRSGGKTITNFRAICPLYTTDGINEKGLCVNTNIILHEDYVRKGYIANTGVADKPKTSFVSLPRYILDNCATADDAVRLCSELNLSQAYTNPLSGADSHIMVSDKNKTVILEWFNNKMVYTEFLPCGNLFKSPEGMPAIMTNFFNCVGKKHLREDGSIILDSILTEHPYAMGVERYETLRQGLDQVTTLESAQQQIEKVHYSHYYNSGNNWYTENGGVCSLVGNDWYYPTDLALSAGGYRKAEGIVDAIHQICEPGGYQELVNNAFGSLDKRMQDLDRGIECENEWYTELTDIFDINNKELYIMPQEGWYKHEYIKFTLRGQY